MTRPRITPRRRARSFFAGFAGLGGLGGLVLLAGCLDAVTPPQLMTGCKSAGDCKGDSAAICDVLSHTCRPCSGAMDDAACRDRNGATPRCGPAGLCVPECSTPGQSGECKDPLLPTCAGGVCQGCQTAADCTSQACKGDGSCYAVADVVHVDNQAGKCMAMVSHKGSADDPLCEVQAGVDLARTGNRPAVHVAGSKVPYAPVAVTQALPLGVLLSGSMNGADPPAILGDGPALTIDGAAGPVAVSVRGLSLGSKLSDAVVCDQKTGAMAPALTLVQSTVQNGLFGIRASRCTLTLDRVQVAGMRQGGLLLAGGSYTIDNIWVYDNTGPGVTISNAGDGSVLRFSTIYGNTALGQLGSGVDCGGQAVLIEDSIVFSNFGGTSQFRGCKLSNVVTGTEMVPGGMAKSPEFVSAARPFDLHLKRSPANLDCCIDKIGQAAGLIDHDIDGRRRPQGSGWDIGAHEVP